MMRAGLSRLDRRSRPSLQIGIASDASVDGMRGYATPR